MSYDGAKKKKRKRIMRTRTRAEERAKAVAVKIEPDNSYLFHKMRSFHTVCKSIVITVNTS